jgi:L-fucose isomerase
MKPEKCQAPDSSGAAGGPVIGLFAPCDPRIDRMSRQRAVNIVRLAAEALAGKVRMPDGAPVPIVYSDILVDGERYADAVARQFKGKGVNVLVGLPDTWAFPQLTVISLLAHFPTDTPINLTCGNCAPKPGVVYTHAVSGALSQSGRLVHINVGHWPDSGLRPEMDAGTLIGLVDWAYAAMTFQALKGRRVVVLGHDSMGMETALAHVLETRRTFGLEMTRLDMKLVADMLNKKAYPGAELGKLRRWLEGHAGKRLAVRDAAESARLDQSLAMYLIIRGLLADLDAVGGGFMSQLEWGSDTRGLPLPVADIMESLFNSTFDHKGRKPVMPFATEADVQGLLTMLFMTWLSGGHPPLFMDFRKVWEGPELADLARSLGLKPKGDALWEKKGIVDGDNSGSASFDWAAKPGAPVEEIMKGISFPQADPDYFPGGGNSAAFISPGGIEGIAGRLAFSGLNGMFSLFWDEAETVDLPAKLAAAVSRASNATWPHTFVCPRYATMGEYKHYAPANHLHMTWDLAPARLQYWMDLANVLSVTPWSQKPAYREGIDRPLPLLYLLNGGETQTKILRARS